LSSSRDDGFGGADEARPTGFFRGSELSKLLVLLTIAVVGWILVWKYVHLDQELAEVPEPAPQAVPSKVERDESPAFESVTDKTAIGLRDMAAYDLLLKRARETSAESLARQSRGDLYFTHLWEHPDQFRGVPIHLLGTARRIISYESGRTPRGRLYEAWITTHESQGHPYCCVFEDLPRGLPLGPDVSERVVFNGYFLKQMRYLAGRDIQRAAPVLIGRIGWTPGPTATRRDNSVLWMISIVGVLFAISLFRWLAGLRRSLSARSRPPVILDNRAEEIAPEDLARWVDSIQKDESEPEPEPDV
jgi:hypothetical protein